mmetsp:Transcript_3665/g.6513  ORF Transcript_3665/g.6513 Transcript_3665/m.6513 type:complete len:219 (+) Transcript_3665:147-803(+)
MVEIGASALLAHAGAALAASRAAACVTTQMRTGADRITLAMTDACATNGTVAKRTHTLPIHTLRGATFRVASHMLTSTPCVLDTDIKVQRPRWQDLPDAFTSLRAVVFAAKAFSLNAYGISDTVASKVLARSTCVRLTLLATIPASVSALTGLATLSITMIYALSPDCTIAFLAIAHVVPTIRRSTRGIATPVFTRASCFCDAIAIESRREVFCPSAN